MWEDVLKTRSHWKVLSEIQNNFIEICRRADLIYEITYPYDVGDGPIPYNRNYDKQYEFLYNILRGVLGSMGRGSGHPVHEKSISQPTNLGGESFRHRVYFVVEDAKFSLFLNIFRTEPVEAHIFFADMSFTVPEKFWGDKHKISFIRQNMMTFLEKTGFILNADHSQFATNVIDYLDIEDPPEGKEEDLNEWWGRVSSEATVMEGTERERWWE